MAYPAQAWCLTLAANAITAWMPEYLGLAVEQLRFQGRLVDDTLLTHMSPAQSEPIGLIGTITVDIDHELAQLDPTGHRPLREPVHPHPDLSPPLFTGLHLDASADLVRWRRDGWGLRSIRKPRGVASATGRGLL